MKRAEKLAGNKGLEAIAKMCINGPSGKWGFNPAKQKAVRIVQDTADFFKDLCGNFEEVTIDIITEEVALARVNESNNMTQVI